MSHAASEQRGRSDGAERGLRAAHRKFNGSRRESTMCEEGAGTQGGAGEWRAGKERESETNESVGMV